MLSGLDAVMGREGWGEMGRLVRMGMAHHVVETCRLISGHAVNTAIADNIGDRCDPIPGLDRNSGPIGSDAFAQSQYAATHLVARHHAAATANLAFPHMNFRAADVGLGDFRDQSVRLGVGNLVLVKFDGVRAGDESDFTLHKVLPLQPARRFMIGAPAGTTGSDKCAIIPPGRVNVKRPNGSVKNGQDT
jgi:hypothetical protein